MDDDFGGGIPITVNSMLILGAVLACGCSIVTLVAVLGAQSDPTWTAAHTIVGIICAVLAGLVAAALAGAFIIRRARRGR